VATNKFFIITKSTKTFLYKEKVSSVLLHSIETIYLLNKSIRENDECIRTDKVHTNLDKLKRLHQAIKKLENPLDDVDAIYADYYDGTEGQYENDQIATTSTFSKILFAALILFFIVAFLYHAINLNHSAPDIPTSGQ